MNELKGFIRQCDAEIALLKREKRQARQNVSQDLIAFFSCSSRTSSNERIREYEEHLIKVYRQAKVNAINRLEEIKDVVLEEYINCIIQDKRQKSLAIL